MTAELATMTTSQLLLAADQERPRTQQVEMGMSDLGSCRRRTGYKLAMTPHVNRAGSIQAAIGTAVHDMLQRVLAKLVDDGDLVEAEVTFAGIKGHLDRYIRASKTVHDTKTTTSRNLEHIKLHGPDDGHVWQVACLAAGLLQAGHPVEYVAVEYLARDTGEEWLWGPWPLDPQWIRDALDWLKLVRDTPLDALPRDYDPDSMFCQGCPYGGPDGGVCWEGHVPGRDFRSVLYAENPDGEYWSDLLWELRNSPEAKARDKQMADARGALTAVVDPTGMVTKVGNRYLRYDSAGRMRFVPAPKTQTEAP